MQGGRWKGGSQMRLAELQIPRWNLEFQILTEAWCTILAGVQFCVCLGYSADNKEMKVGSSTQV